MSEDRNSYLGRVPPSDPFRRRPLPFRGFVSAGGGELADTFDEEREVDVPRGGATFLLQVGGDSMARAGILDDDILCINPGRTPRHGDIVVAYIEGTGEVVKRLRLETDRETGEPAVWLDSESLETDIAPIRLQGGSKVQGVVTGVQREL